MSQLLFTGETVTSYFDLYSCLMSLVNVPKKRKNVSFCVYTLLCLITSNNVYKKSEKEAMQ